MVKNLNGAHAQFAIWIIIIVRNTCREVIITEETCRLLKQTPENIKVIGIDLAAFCRFIEFGEHRHVIEMWRIVGVREQVSFHVVVFLLLFGFFRKREFGFIFAEKKFAGIFLQFIAKNIEKQRMMRGYNCLYGGLGLSTITVIPTERDCLIDRDLIDLRFFDS